LNGVVAGTSNKDAELASVLWYVNSRHGLQWPYRPGLNGAKLVFLRTMGARIAFLVSYFLFKSILSFDA
jgi:hypothetical protein